MNLRRPAASRPGRAAAKLATGGDNAEKDFDIAQSMGLNSLRLSISWARIEPSEGIFNAAAVQRYRQMLSALIERNIQPIVLSAPLCPSNVV